MFGQHVRHYPARTGVMSHSILFLLRLAFVVFAGAAYCHNALAQPSGFGKCHGNAPPASGDKVSPGRWWNPERPGHGIDLYINNYQNLVLTWYTYDTYGNPVWYQGSAYYIPGSSRWSADLFEFHAVGGNTASATIESTDVGSVTLEFLDNDHNSFNFTWTLNTAGLVPQRSWATKTECYRIISRPSGVVDGSSLNSTSSLGFEYSGHWYAAWSADAGWGLLVTQESASDPNPSDLEALAIYDERGWPVWVQGLANRVPTQSASLTMKAVTGYCPTCDVPADPTQFYGTGGANNLTRTFYDANSGKVTAEIIFPAQISRLGEWKRYNAPIRRLTEGDQCLGGECDLRGQPNPDKPLPPAGKPDYSRYKPGSSRIGTTAGTFKVDRKGSATYTIPIMTAPGSGGLAPKVNLYYDSQKGLSAVGMRWGIGGLSAITRCAQTIEQDGHALGLTMTATDRFCLDGKRLILVPGTGPYGTNGAVYVTEIDTHVKIVSHGSAGGGPSYFKVWHKDGSISWYGGTSTGVNSARIDGVVPGSPATVFAWAQARFMDSAGNYVDYVYNQPVNNSAEYHINEIRFTGNVRAGIAPNAEIRFIYGDNRPREKVISFVDGVRITNTRRLERIDSVVVGRGYLRRYKLKYGGDGAGRSVLANIQECGISLNYCLPPTRFTWQPTRLTFGSTRFSPTIGSQIGHFSSAQPADVNADGKQDLVFTTIEGKQIRFGHALGGCGSLCPPTLEDSVHSDLSDIENPDRLEWRVMDFDGDGYQDIVYGYKGTWYGHKWADVGNSLGGAQVIGHYADVGSPLDLRVSDYDGDGLADLLYAPSAGGHRLYVAYSIADQPGGTATDPIYLAPNEHIQVDVDGSQFPPGPNRRFLPKLSDAVDFNGDGRVDVLMRIWDRDLCTTPLEVATGDNQIEQGVPDDPNDPVAPSDPSDPGRSLSSSTTGPVSGAAGDCPPSRSAWFVFVSGTDANGEPMLKQWAVLGDAILSETPVTNTGRTLSYNGLYAADINGDGLGDLVYYDSQNNQWIRQLSHGDRLGAARAFSADFPLNAGDHLRIRDYDGDGLADLIAPSDDSSETAHWIVQKWRWWAGGTFAGTSETTTARAGCLEACTGGEYYQSVFMDVNGDAKSDQIFITINFNGDYPKASLKVALGFDELASDVSYSPHYAIVGITNGLGAEIVIDYGALTQDSVYTRGEAIAPSDYSDWGKGSVVYNITPPVYVVSEVFQSAPIAGNPGAYASLRYHYNGARVQGGGRGFLGFSRIAKYNSQTHVLTTTLFHQAFPFIGKPDVVCKEYQAWAPWASLDDGPLCLNNGVRLKRTDKKWLDRTSVMDLPGAGVAYVPRSRMVWMEYSATDSYAPNQSLSASSHIKTRVVRNLLPPTIGGALRKTAVTSRNSAGGWVSQKITTNTYSRDDQQWILARLQRSVVTHKRPGQDTIRRTSTFDYDPSTGILIKERVEPGTQVRLAIDYTLDVFGNRIKKEVWGAGVPPRITSFIYDSRGRFINKTYRQLDGRNQLISTVVARDRFGNSTRIRDQEGVVTHIEYDYLGRKFFTYKPTGESVWYLRQDSYGARRSCGISVNAYRLRVGSSGKPVTYICIDKVGRQHHTITRAHTEDAKHIHVQTYFDKSGRVTHQSEPRYSGQPVRWTYTKYDDLGRPVSIRRPDYGLTRFTYEGLRTTTRTTVYDPLGPETVQTRIEHKNLLGELVKVRDANGGITTYRYDAVGNLIETDGPLPGSQDAIYVYFDPWGRFKMRMDDPDQGVWHYRHNALGQLQCQRDAKGQGIRVIYDDFGRKTRRREYTGVPIEGGLPVCHRGDYHGETVWFWENNASANGFGQLDRMVVNVADAPWVETNYGYDYLGRVREVVYHTETGVNTHQYETLRQRTTYDKYSRVFQSFDGVEPNSGKRFYYSRGYLVKVQEAREGELEGTVYRTILAYDPYGHVTSERLGNGAETLRQYDEVGRLTTILTTGPQNQLIQDLTYTWDTAGNLVRRVDGASSGSPVREDFRYDPLNRLTGVYLTDPEIGYDHRATMITHYNAGGNITHKSGNGPLGYRYGTKESGCGLAADPGPHAISFTTRHDIRYCYDANGAQLRSVSSGGQTKREIRYNRRHQAESVTTPTTQTTFAYGPRGRLARRSDQSVEGTERAYLFGAVTLRIKSHGTRVWHRRLGAVLVKYYEASNVVDVTYVHRDFLGSPETLTDAQGRVLVRLSFDAFGERRAAGDWRAGAPGPSFAALNQILHFTRKGFTGHEQIDAAGIIHMGGRLYDPRLGRFLQADPFIQAPGLTQNYNRYTYVLNNPLAYTDPSGHLFAALFTSILMAGGVESAVGIGILLAGVEGYMTTGNLAGSVLYMGSAIASHGVGSAFGGRAEDVGITQAVVEKAVVHGIVQGSLSAAGGGDFEGGFTGSFISGLAGGLAGGLAELAPVDDADGLVLAMVVGGASAEAFGGNFMGGATSAAFVYVFNSEAHKNQQGKQRGARTEISVGYTDTPVQIANHALIIGTDPLTREEFATRAGPGQCVIGVCIRAVARPFNATFEDPPSSVHTIQYVGTLAISLDEFAARALEFANVTNSTNLPYLGATWNSNSYAFTFIESLGFDRPTPLVWAPGWRAGIPSSELTYP